MVTRRFGVTDCNDAWERTGTLRSGYLRVDPKLGELLTFVREPDVPPDNNAAERSLRQLTISRKVSGGSRSADGTATKIALATHFGTWQAQGVNLYIACRQLLSLQV